MMLALPTVSAENAAKCAETRSTTAMADPNVPVLRLTSRAGDHTSVKALPQTRFVVLPLQVSLPVWLGGHECLWVHRADIEDRLHQRIDLADE
jgi:hypothetical protein